MGRKESWDDARAPRFFSEPRIFWTTCSPLSTIQNWGLPILTLQKLSERKAIDSNRSKKAKHIKICQFWVALKIKRQEADVWGEKTDERHGLPPEPQGLWQGCSGRQREADAEAAKICGPVELEIFGPKKQGEEQVTKQFSGAQQKVVKIHGKRKQLKLLDAEVNPMCKRSNEMTFSQIRRGRWPSFFGKLTIGTFVRCTVYK